MQKVFAFLLCILLCGCVTIEERTSSFSFVPEEKKEKESERIFISTRQVLEGMTKKEVQSVLGKEILVGYELSNKDGGQYKPITIQNPYRSQQIKKGEKSYEVDYYLVEIDQQDNVVEEDELVPLVFLNDKLVGKGWDFFNKNIKNY